MSRGELRRCLLPLVRTGSQPLGCWGGAQPALLGMKVWWWDMGMAATMARGAEYLELAWVLLLVASFPVLPSASTGPAPKHQGSPLLQPPAGPRAARTYWGELDSSTQGCDSLGAPSLRVQLGSVQ